MVELALSVQLRTAPRGEIDLEVGRDLLHGEDDLLLERVAEAWIGEVEGRPPMIGAIS